MSLREMFEEHRRRFVSPEELAARVREAVGHLDRDDDLGFRLTTEALVFDPYNVELHLALARSYARRGEAEKVLPHLTTCFEIDAVDGAALLADPSLRGALPDETFEGLVDRILSSGKRWVRIKDACYDEVAPRMREFETELRWPPENHAGALETYRRLHEHIAGVYESSASDLDSFTSPFRLGEYSPSTFCAYGRLHQWLREVAPYVEDVRFFFYDQVSPLDEIWIVDGVCYLRRHPIDDIDDFSLATHLHDLIEREQLVDPVLRRFVVMHLYDVASRGLDEYRRSRDADGLAMAELSVELLVGYGEAPIYLQARLHAARGEVDEERRSLRRAVEIAPTRASVEALARRCFADEDFEEAAALAARASLMDGWHDHEGIHLVEAMALESLGRHDEALAAYRAHIQARGESYGVLFSDAKMLVGRGWLESARTLFAALGEARFVAVDAETWAAKCSEDLGDIVSARMHYENVLRRFIEVPSTDRDRDERLEQQARAKLGLPTA